MNIMNKLNIMNELNKMNNKGQDMNMWWWVMGIVLALIAIIVIAYIAVKSGDVGGSILGRF